MEYELRVCENCNSTAYRTEFRKGTPPPIGDEVSFWDCGIFWNHGVIEKGKVMARMIPLFGEKYGGIAKVWLYPNKKLAIKSQKT